MPDNNVLPLDPMYHSTLPATGGAIIVGASLAGLMAGLALAGAGYRVTIIERAGSSPRSGAALQVSSGEEDQSVTATFLRQLASEGKRSVEAWSSVQQRLQAAALASPRISIHYNTRVRSTHQDSSSAWAITDNGATFRGDVLIGADGYRSVVRSAVAKGSPDAKFAGYMIWVAMLEERAIPRFYWPGSHAGTSMPDGIGDFLLGSVIAGADGSTDVGSRRLSWAWYDNTHNTLLRQLGCVRNNLVHHSLVGTDVPEHTLAELSLQAAQRWPQPWLAATQQSIASRSITGIPVSEYVPDRLAVGRIAITGDAAHTLTPLTAMGFNAALQDAATIADCLAKAAPAGIPGALADYQRHRLRHVRQQVASGQPFSKSFGR